MKVIAMIQARMGSTRLPGKILKTIHNNKTLLEMVINQLSYSKELTETLVLTTIAENDRPVVELCQHIGIQVFTGSVADVLDRYYQSARQVNPDHILRITADCPLIDPEIVDQLIRLHLEHKNDYTSNTLKETFPDGLDAEVFTMNSLKIAWRLAKKKSEREHVTPYLKNHPEQFSLENLESRENLNRMRWTVDEAADLALIRKIYADLGPITGYIKSYQVIQYLRENPQLLDLNGNITRNQGYLDSLEQDE